MAVVDGTAVVVDGVAVVCGTFVVVVSDVIRGIVSSGVASRESAQAVVAIADVTAATANHRRATIAGRAAIGPVSTRSGRGWGHPPPTSLVHCAAVPDKRVTLLTALTVVAVAAFAVSASGDDGDDGPTESPAGAGRFTGGRRPGDVAAAEQLDIDVDINVNLDDHDDHRSGARRPRLPGRPRRQQLVHAGGPLLLPSHRHLLQLRVRDRAAGTGHRSRRRGPVTNTWDPDVGDPATRGGNAVSIIGDDGVRYYLAHFQLIDPAIIPGARVVAGDFLGEMGDTGRAGACHVHFALSLPCPNREWWVRRGVIWPDEYLTSWQRGWQPLTAPRTAGVVRRVSRRL